MQFISIRPDLGWLYLELRNRRSDYLEMKLASISRNRTSRPRVPTNDTCKSMHWEIYQITPIYFFVIIPDETGL